MIYKENLNKNYLKLKFNCKTLKILKSEKESNCKIY